MQAKFGAEQPSIAQAGLVLAGHLLEGVAHRALHRVVDLDILGARAEMPGQGEKARMLARAVVVHLARRLAGVAQPMTLGRVVGHLRAAAQVGVAQSEFAEPAPPPGSTWIAAPLCEAQASASCSVDSRAPAPLSSSGSACSILHDERG